MDAASVLVGSLLLLLVLLLGVPLSCGRGLMPLSSMVATEYSSKSAQLLLVYFLRGSTVEFRGSRGAREVLCQTEKFERDTKGRTTVCMSRGRGGKSFVIFEGFALTLEATHSMVEVGGEVIARFFRRCCSC